jgi:hypothetical protein
MDFLLHGLGIRSNDKRTLEAKASIPRADQPLSRRGFCLPLECAAIVARDQHHHDKSKA